MAPLNSPARKPWMKAQENDPDLLLQDQGDQEREPRNTEQLEPQRQSEQNHSTNRLETENVPTASNPQNGINEPQSYLDAARNAILTENLDQNRSKNLKSFQNKMNEKQNGKSTKLSRQDQDGGARSKSNQDNDPLIPPHPDCVCFSVINKQRGAPNQSSNGTNNYLNSKMSALDHKIQSHIDGSEMFRRSNINGAASQHYGMSNTEIPRAVYGAGIRGQIDGGGSQHYGSSEEMLDPRMFFPLHPMSEMARQGYKDGTEVQYFGMPQPSAGAPRTAFGAAPRTFHGADPLHYGVPYNRSMIDLRMGAPQYPMPGLAAPGMAAPGMAAPGMAAPGMATPGMAKPGMAAPGMTARGTFYGADSCYYGMTNIGTPGFRHYGMSADSPLIDTSMFTPNYPMPDMQNCEMPKSGPHETVHGADSLPYGVSMTMPTMTPTNYCNMPQNSTKMHQEYLLEMSKQVSDCAYDLKNYEVPDIGTPLRSNSEEPLHSGMPESGAKWPENEVPKQINGAGSQNVFFVYNGQEWDLTNRNIDDLIQERNMMLYHGNHGFETAEISIQDNNMESQIQGANCLDTNIKGSSDDSFETLLADAEDVCKQDLSKPKGLPNSEVLPKSQDLPKPNYPGTNFNGSDEESFETLLADAEDVCKQDLSKPKGLPNLQDLPKPQGLPKPSEDFFHLIWFHNEDKAECQRTCEIGKPPEKPTKYKAGYQPIYERVHNYFPKLDMFARHLMSLVKSSKSSDVLKLVDLHDGLATEPMADPAYAECMTEALFAKLDAEMRKRAIL